MITPASPFSMTMPSDPDLLRAGSGAVLGAARAPETDRSSFARVLGQVTSDAATPEQAARRSAESLVSMTFVQPLLKQLRETSKAAAPFAPTQGERQFQGLLDAELAERLVRKGNFPIVDRITQQLLQKNAETQART